jgi:hypothetical protein
MPKSDVHKPDTWRCLTLELPQKRQGDVAVTAWRAMPSEPTLIHHQTVAFCEHPLHGPDKGVYDCKVEGFPCFDHGSQTFVGGYDFMSIKTGGRVTDAQSNFPRGVGLSVGPRTKHRYAVLQVHNNKALKGDQSGFELTMAPGMPPNQYSMTLMASNDFVIPPGQESYKVPITDTSALPKGPMNVFAVRAHFHLLGKRAGVTGLGDDKSHHFFTPEKMMMRPAEPLLVQDPSKLAAHCTYDSRKKKTPTKMGFDATQEMCDMWFLSFQATPKALLVSTRKGGEDQVPMATILQQHPELDRPGRLEAPVRLGPYSPWAMHAAHTTANGHGH